MTEEEWLACSDPIPMLEFLRSKASKRKLQLFVCAACRRFWPKLKATGLRNAVEISERYADNKVVEFDLMDAAQAAWAIVRPLRRNAPEYRASWAAAWSTAPANRYFAENAIAYLLTDARGGIINYLLGTMGVLMAEPEQLRHVALLYEIFGNPFRPAIIDRSWLTSNVVALAGNMYESRDFSSMPVLGDALQDAGCEDETVLNHCRQAAEHVCGCWLIDSLLGKE